MSESIEKQIRDAWALFETRNALFLDQGGRKRDWEPLTEAAMNLVEILRSPEAREWMRGLFAGCYGRGSDEQKYDSIINAACGPEAKGESTQ